MRSFIKGVVTGTLLGALAGAFMKPNRKREISDLINVAEESQLAKRTGKVIRGVAKSVDRIVK